MLFSSICLLGILLPPSSAKAQTGTAHAFDGAIVVLVNAETGRFLDADRNGDVNQSRVQREDDLWVLRQSGLGYYTLQNWQYEKLLDADGRRSGYDVNLSRNEEPDTQWEIIALDDGTFELINVEFGRALDADWGGSGFAVNLTDNRGDTDARWHIGQAFVPPTDFDGAEVLIVNSATGRFLDADPDGSVNQSTVPGADDRWLLELLDDGNYTIRNLEHDLRLGGADGGVDLTAGATGATWSIPTGTAQQYTIQHVDSGLWLDADWGDRDYDVNLTVNGSDTDAMWQIMLLDYATATR